MERDNSIRHDGARPIGDNSEAEGCRCVAQPPHGRGHVGAGSHLLFPSSEAENPLDTALQASGAVTCIS